MWINYWEHVLLSCEYLFLSLPGSMAVFIYTIMWHIIEPINVLKFSSCSLGLQWWGMNAVGNIEPITAGNPERIFSAINIQQFTLFNVLSITDICYLLGALFSARMSREMDSNVYHLLLWNKKNLYHSKNSTFLTGLFTLISLRILDSDWLVSYCNGQWNQTPLTCVY